MEFITWQPNELPPLCVLQQKYKINWLGYCPITVHRCLGFVVIFSYCVKCCVKCCFLLKCYFGFGFVVVFSKMLCFASQGHHKYQSHCYSPSVNPANHPPSWIRDCQSVRREESRGAAIPLSLPWLQKSLGGIMFYQRLIRCVCVFVNVMVLNALPASSTEAHATCTCMLWEY